MTNLRTILARLINEIKTKSATVFNYKNTPLIILVVVALIASTSLIGYAISHDNKKSPILGARVLRTEPQVTAIGPTPHYPPTATTAPPTTTPPVTTAPPTGSIDSTGNYIACPNTPDASAPSGTTFSGHTYDGAHAVLNSDVAYSVGSNTCIENFSFTNGQLNIQGGASNVLIINNKMTNWPYNGAAQGRAIDGILSGGSNIVINYNSFSNPSGGNLWTGIYGRGGVNGLTITHNFWGALNVDDMQINCTNTCYNVILMYNRMTQAGRFIDETQQIVHNERQAYNYADVTYATNQGGQFSVAHSNDHESGGGYYNDISSGIEIDHNIVLDPGKQAQGGDCFESRGPGNNFHDNYCWGFRDLIDYAFTSPQSFAAPNHWSVTNNTIVGNGSGAVSEWEGFERSGYSQVPPTESGNIRLSYATQPSPSPPAWTYDNGAQW